MLFRDVGDDDPHRPSQPWGADCTCTDPHDNAMRAMKTNKSSSTKGAQDIKSGPVNRSTVAKDTQVILKQQICVPFDAG
jgi:hypothetical protein